MSPIKVLNSTVISITILIMSLILIFVIPIITKNEYKILVSVLSAAGLYNLLYQFLYYSFNSILWLKRILLGDGFLNGTWIGIYSDSSGQQRILVEKFYQDLDRLTIKGTSLDDKGKTKVQWTSDTTSIDSKRKSLYYSYSCNNFNKSSTVSGIAEFEISRDENNKYPKHLIGYSADIANGIKHESEEFKISDKILDTKTAFKIAVKRYKT